MESADAAVTCFSGKLERMQADMDERLRLAKAGVFRRPAPDLEKESDACDAARIGKLTNGTRLELLLPPAECYKASMDGPGKSHWVKVRVISGKNEGKVGCTFSDDIVEDGTEPTPTP